MAILRTDIERALDEISSQEEGMRFQGLAVVLGKKRWPELIAHQRKKDLGLDAYAPARLTPEKIGKGLAASITPTLKKLSDDAKTAKENYPDLKAILFVTPAKVGQTKRKQWEEEMQRDHDLELHILEREEIITEMMMPENASLQASFLNLESEPEPQTADLIDKTRRAADVVVRTWARRTKGRPLIGLAAVRLDPSGEESADVLSLAHIDEALSQSRRIILEGSAGCGKTTTLIQIAQRPRTSGTPFVVDLPAWTSSRRGILEYIAAIPAFQAEGLTSGDLARAHLTEPFLFLLNGWNEVAESNSAQANDALRELERDFPSAGIIVATRTHHLTPPLPGALRLRLLRLQRGQVSAYLDNRLGAKAAELRARIDADQALDDLTRTPFILSEVASLFEAGAEIPTTKLAVLAQVLHLQEQRDEHRNALHAGPIFGLQADYMKALALELTRRGAIALPEADARTIVAAIVRELAFDGQVEAIGAPAVLAALTAHHVLERVDYPQTAYQFEHQQLQEFYAALDVQVRLLALNDDDPEGADRFTAEYMNDPAWAEPLRMCAEALAARADDDEVDQKRLRTAGKLVEMALAVDLVFAGELAYLCGAAVWDGVGPAVGKRLRDVYAIEDGNYRQYAVAAMLATGADDFGDIIVPLLSGEDQQTRLRTYRLWPDLHVSSLGSDWRDLVRGWSEKARSEFVSELLHHRVDDVIAAFAAEDESDTVKEAAVVGLMWTGSDVALTRVLESMNAPTFEDVARKNADRMPAGLRPRTVAAMRRLVENTTDVPARLGTALRLIELGETGLDDVVKDAMEALSGDNMRNLGPHFIEPALEHLSKRDPGWSSKWVARQIAEGSLYDHEYWLPFAPNVPAGLVESDLHRLETEDLKNRSFKGMVAVIAASAGVDLAARVFAKLRELRGKVDAEPGQRHELEWQLMRQLEALFRCLPDDVAAAAVLSSVTSGTPLDIKVAADILSRVARSDVEPLQIADGDLKVRLRAYLKDSVELVLRQDDFNGQEKANLASSIAQVGKPEDIADLVTLIRADIDRVRRGRAARAAGDRGPLGNGGSMRYAGWHIAAILHLDSDGTDQVLMDLLSEPEYRSDAAAAMARDFLPKRQGFFDRAFRYDLMRAAREDRISPPGDELRRVRFGAALKDEIRRLRDQNPDGEPAAGLKELAKALAAVDGRGSADVVIDVIALPGEWDQYTSLDAAERLMLAGVVLPTAAVFALVDSIIARTERWMQGSDSHLLCRSLALCPFIADPSAGVAKMRDVLIQRRLRGHELRELITALGESRSDAAVELLFELATDAQTLKQCEDDIVRAVASVDTPRARELLMGIVDPAVPGISLQGGYRSEAVMFAQFLELAGRSPEVAGRLLELCEYDLPEFNRHVLAKVMEGLGTPEAFAANLNLIDDTKPHPVPRGVWDHLEGAFVGRRPYGQSANAFTLYARAANELRARLFGMVLRDPKRRKSAFVLLGQIEVWRLEYGRPTDEPRHPDLASGQPWPPPEP